MKPFLAAVATAACLATPAVAAAQDTEHVISVLGNGQVELKPDRGSFSVGVTHVATRADDARSKANAVMARIVRGLRSAGVDKDGLTTTQVSINRERRRKGKDGPVFFRFRTSVGLRVSVEGLALVGRAIDVASKRGATDVYGPQLGFSPDRRADGEERSAAAALDDARSRADAAAAHEGQRIVDVQSIELDPGQGQYAPFALESAGASADRSVSSPTKILSAKRKVTTQARVTYVIEPIT